LQTNLHFRLTNKISYPKIAYLIDQNSRLCKNWIHQLSVHSHYTNSSVTTS